MPKTRCLQYCLRNLCILLGIVPLLFPGASHGAFPICARVKIEISQEMTFERIAFDARLKVANNHPDTPLENVNVSLSIMDEESEDASNLFFVRISSINNITDVSGSGIIPPNVSSEIHWLIIPSPGTGGTEQIGRRFYVGGDMQFTVNGIDQTLTLLPQSIIIKPQPELVLDYFLPREVWADDPFTDPVEAPIPFSLGVRVKNAGYGPAPELKINSGQPKIVENKQGLLIDFRLIGSSVNDEEVSPTLNLMMGYISPQSCVTGRWEMVTTLSGKFIDFNAEYTHASELGGELTSLINQVNTHFLTHEVLVDTVGSDSTLDFLAYDNPNSNRMPDTIYTSNCLELPVNPVAGIVTGSPSPANPSIILDITTFSGWIYTKVLDPANGQLQIMDATRSDGKNIDPHNVWISEEKPTGKQADPSAFYLNLTDNDTTGQYVITYQTPEADMEPPDTTIIIEEPKYGLDPVYVTSLTNFMFVASDDISGVAAILYNLDGSGFEPAFPFNLNRLILPGEPLEGPHTIEFYSKDFSNNEEAVKTQNVYVDDSAPVVDNFTVTPDVITPSAPDGSDFDKEAVLRVQVTDVISPVFTKYQIAMGLADNDDEFDTLAVVRTMESTLISGIPENIVWNGRDDEGNIVSSGNYTIRLTATDQLGHSIKDFISITVREFLSIELISSTNFDQMYPSLSGSKVVWQDYRNDNWDIFLYDLDTNTLMNLTHGKIADQIRPSIAGNNVVWQDRSTGNWDIVLYNLETSSEKPIAASLEAETNPFIEGNRVAYQRGSSGNQDIYVYNIANAQTGQITTDLRDQLNPAISGNILVWEDYRHGLAEIYAYDLINHTETRLTNNIDNQTHPAIYGDRVLWVDQRHGNRELYTSRLSNIKEERLTFTSTDEAQPCLNGSYAVYVDYASGLSQPNLSIVNIITKRSMRLISDSNRQEQPKLFGTRLVWQDNRSGNWQIYYSEITLPITPVTYALDAGFNLVAVTRGMVDLYGDTFSLLNAWKSEFDVKTIYAYDPVNGEMMRAEPDETGTPVGTNLSLVENSALFVDSESAAEVILGNILECTPLNLRNGFNLVSFACVPNNYMAFDMIRSLGLDLVLSISRFDNKSARWLTTAVDESTVAGENFMIRPGEGYIIYTTGEINNWIP